MNQINFLTISEIIKFHEKLINKYGRIHGIRDRALLESALAQPKMTILVHMPLKIFLKWQLLIVITLQKTIHLLMTINERVYWLQ